LQEREEAILPFSFFLSLRVVLQKGEQRSMPQSMILVVVLSVVAFSPAYALKLTNRDATEQKMTISENTASREQVLKPSETLDGICSAGCTIQMQDGEEYEFDGNEIVSIEEGLMFLDEPAQGQGSSEPQKQ
jgi:hypothetical protein